MVLREFDERERRNATYVGRDVYIDTDSRGIRSRRTLPNRIPGIDEMKRVQTNVFEFATTSATR